MYPDKSTPLHMADVDIDKSEIFSHHYSQYSLSFFVQAALDTIYPDVRSDNDQIPASEF